MAGASADKIPKSLLIVEDDDSVILLYNEFSKQMNIPLIRSATNGVQARKTMDKRAFDVVFTDWKMPEGSGLALINTIQALENGPYQAIVVCSGFLVQEDWDFLKEFPCVEALEKPCNYQDFRQTVLSVHQKSQWYQRRANIVQDAIGMLVTSRDSAIAELNDLMAEVPDPATFSFIIGKRLLALKDYKRAEPFLQKAYDIEPQNGFFANNLAKAYAGVGKHKETLKLLSQPSLGSRHYERFFLLGEANLNDLKPQEAEKCFKKALELDPNSEAAAEAVDLSISVRQFQTHNPLATASKDCASLFNNIGVTMAQKGEPEKAIGFYEKALKFLTEPAAIYSVTFNLALAYLKVGDKDQAKIHFKTVTKAEQKLADKAKKYLKAG